jgi:hypothetical protein
MLAVSSSVFVCNSRFPFFCPVRKHSTSVLWRAGRRLACLFNAASRAQVQFHITKKQRTATTYLFVTMMSVSGPLPHCKTTTASQVSFDRPPPPFSDAYVITRLFVLSFQCLFHSDCVVFRMLLFILWVFSYPVHADVFLSVVLLLYVFLLLFVLLFFVYVFVIRWSFVLLCVFCYSLYLFVISWMCWFL